MKSLLRLIAASIISMSIFAFFYVMVESSILMSMLFGAASLIGSILLFSPKKIDPKMEELTRIHGITPAMLHKIVKEGRGKVIKLEKSTSKIKDRKIANKIYSICEVIEKIFKDLEYDPKDVKAARQFLNYYLDAIVKIVNHYTVLSHDNVSQEEKNKLQKVEHTLDTIEQAFKNQLTKLYEDDYLDLETEISVLKKALEADGLDK